MSSFFDYKGGSIWWHYRDSDNAHAFLGGFFMRITPHPCFWWRSNSYVCILEGAENDEFVTVGGLIVIIFVLSSGGIA